MTLLVIETGFAALSVALIAGGQLLAEHHEIVGRGHAERLLPAIAALLQDHPPPDALLVDSGPGSYTGLRVGIAAARALGFAWGIDVTATTSTALLAAGAFARNPGLAVVTAVLDAGRDFIYVETITADWRGSNVPRVATPAAIAASLPRDAVLIGSGAALLQKFGPFAAVTGDFPRAADARTLPEARRRAAPTPRYLEPVPFVELTPAPTTPVLA